MWCFLVSPLAKRKALFWGRRKKSEDRKKGERKKSLSLGEGKRPRKVKATQKTCVCVLFLARQFRFLSCRYSNLPVYAFFFRERERKCTSSHSPHRVFPKTQHQTERHRHATSTPAFCAAMHRVVKHRERAFGATGETPLRRSLLCASRGE